MLKKITNYLALDLMEIRDNLNNLMEIYNFLDELADELKYEKFHKPVLIPYYYGKVANDCGISCYLILNGGYITFHIFEKRNIAYFDIVKDTEIDENIVIQLVTKFVKSKKYHLCSSNRDVDYLSENVFGPHYFCKGEILRDVDVEDLLDFQMSIIKKIDMTPITNPVIIKSKKYIVLFVAIAESHIVLTLKNRILRVDIFSCKMFNLDKLKKVLEQKLKIQNERIFTRLHKLM